MASSHESRSSEQFNFNYKTENLREANEKRKKEKRIKPLDLIRKKSDLDKEDLNKIKIYHNDMKDKQEENHSSLNDGLKKAVAEFADKFEYCCEKHKEFREAKETYLMIQEFIKQAKRVVQERSDSTQIYGQLHKRLMDETNFLGHSTRTQELEKAHETAFEALRNVGRDAQKALNILPKLHQEAKSARQKLKDAYVARESSIKEAENAQKEMGNFMALENAQDLYSRINAIDNKINKKDINILEEKIQIINAIIEEENNNELYEAVKNLSIMETEYKYTHQDAITFTNAKTTFKDDFNEEGCINHANDFAKRYGIAFKVEQPTQETNIKDDYSCTNAVEYIKIAERTFFECRDKYKRNESELENLQKELKSGEISNKRKKSLSRLEIPKKAANILQDMALSISTGRDILHVGIKLQEYFVTKSIQLKKEYNRKYEQIEAEVNKKLILAKDKNEKLLEDLMLKLGKS